MRIDRESGASVPLIADPDSGPGRFLAWAPDSRHVIVVAATFPPEVWVLDVDSQKHVSIDFPESEARTPLVRAAAYSPSGKRLADAVVYPASTSSPLDELEIGIRDSEQGPRTSLLRLPGGVMLPEHGLRWSSDGRQLLFVADVVRNERVTQLWVIDLDKGLSRLLVELAKGVQYGHPAVWSPDGQIIAALEVERSVTSNKTPATNVYLIHPDTDSVEQLTHFSDGSLSWLNWSSDGQWLAFAVSKGDYGEIWVTDRKGARQYPVAGPAVPNTPFVWLP
jgi:Tol biopolymer transport system component